MHPHEEGGREQAESAREAALLRQGGSERLIEFYRMARSVYRREALSAGLHGSWGRECFRGYRMARERLAREGRAENDLGGQ